MNRLAPIVLTGDLPVNKSRQQEEYQRSNYIVDYYFDTFVQRDAI